MAGSSLTFGHTQMNGEVRAGPKVEEVQKNNRAGISIVLPETGQNLIC